MGETLVFSTEGAVDSMVKFRGKAYEQMGWFGGFSHIFGNTPYVNMYLYIYISLVTPHDLSRSILYGNYHGLCRFKHIMYIYIYLHFQNQHACPLSSPENHLSATLRPGRICFTALQMAKSAMATTWRSKLVDKRSIMSGQIIIFHQPRFPWNKGISLTKPPFGVRSCEVAIIWPA